MDSAPTARDTGGMATDDELERLLREVAGLDREHGPPPFERPRRGHERLGGQALYVDLHDTGEVDPAKLEAALPELIGGATPRAIREHLGLNRPIYARTAAYGGRFALHASALAVRGVAGLF